MSNVLLIMVFLNSSMMKTRENQTHIKHTNHSEKKNGMFVVRERSAGDGDVNSWTFVHFVIQAIKV